MTVISSFIIYLINDDFIGTNILQTQVNRKGGPL